MNKAIARLAPLFYLPQEIPAFHDFMWTAQRALASKTTPVVVSKTTPVVVSKTTPVVVSKTAPVIASKTTPVIASKTAPVIASKTTPVVVSKTAPVVRCLLKRRLPPSVISVVADRTFETVSEEMDERQKMALYFHASKSRKLQLKDAGHRLTYADIDSILSDLMTIPRQEGWTSCFGYGWVDLPLCIACAQYYHRDIVVGDPLHQTFVRFLGSQEDKDTTAYFLLDKSKRRLVPTDKVPTETWFEMWDYRKPLRAMSHYKVEDLNKIVHQLPYVGALPKKSTKQDLYTAIEHYCFGLTEAV